MKRNLISQLEKEWEEKLAASGFKDIERTIGNERVLIQYASNCYRQAEIVTIESKFTYYQILSQRIESYQFKNKIHKFVMIMIAEGLRIRQIVEELRKKGIYIHRQTVRFILRRYENMWGLRVWSNKQMNLRTSIR